MTKILIADSEPLIRQALNLSLGAHGYEMCEVNTGASILSVVVDQRPDVVLLDLGSFGMDGTRVVEELRARTKSRVIVLAARDDEASKVQALDAGADDYVTKPFGMAELVARIRALVRRTAQPGLDEPAVRTRHFDLDFIGHRAFVGRTKMETHLTPTEWTIIQRLVQTPYLLVSYHEMVRTVWGPERDLDPNVLRVHMANIRRKLEPEPARPRYFVTDQGCGYRFRSNSAGRSPKSSSSKD